MDRERGAGVVRALGVVAALAVTLSQVPGLAALGSPGARLTDVRFGAHPEFDRVVLELDRAAAVTRSEPGEPDARMQRFVLELAAEPSELAQVISPGLRRVDRISIASVAGGSRIEVAATAGRRRIFQLESPFRIVIDFGETGEGPFEIPQDAAPVRVEPPVVERPPEPPVPPTPTPRPAPSPPSPAAERQPEEIAEPVDREDLDADVRDVEPEVEPRVETRIPPPPRPPQRRLEPPPRPAPLEPEPAPEPELPITLLWLVIPLAVGLGIVWIVTRRSRARQPLPIQRRLGAPGHPPPAEPPSPDDALEASDRMDLLEKRVDEEVRARMLIEERVVQLQEDLKVIRDRLNRQTRG